MDSGNHDDGHWRTWLLDWLANELKLARDEIRPDENLLNYGMDSVNAIMLVGDVEDQLGLKLPPTLVWDYPTVDRLVEKLASESAAAPGRRGAVGAATSEPAENRGSTTGGIDPQRARELLDRLDQLSDLEVETLLEQLKQG